MDYGEIFGPYKIGDYVVEWSYFGLVFRAGPKRFWVIWENGDTSHYDQTYRGFRRAVTASWHDDPLWERRIKNRLAEELALYKSRIRSR